MSSVLAIVSKATFAKMGDGLDVGDLVTTDRYASTPAAFTQLGKSDAIFLVTVRPPSEALWLVAIVEQPKLKGSSWVGKANTTPICDITPLVGQLRFASGKGITAKPGALAMSLQTPRVLTDADVALLRCDNAMTAATDANSEYARQVALTPAAKRAKAQAKLAASEAGGQRLELRNHRRPFQILQQLPKPQYAQLAHLTKRNRAGTPKRCAKDADWVTTELFDVVDRVTGKVTHQLYVGMYATGGQLFEDGTLTTVATIIQHGFEMDPEQDDLGFRKALAAAYAVSTPMPGMHVDFRLDWVPTKATALELDQRARHEAALRKLEAALMPSTERYLVFDELTAAQQADIREVVPHLDRFGLLTSLGKLGLPRYAALAQWAGLVAPTPLEQRVPDAAGGWPAWKWLKAAQVGNIERQELLQHFRKHLGAEDVADIVWHVCRDAENGYELWMCDAGRIRAMNAAQAEMIRLLAALIDGSGDDAAVAFAARAEKFLIADGNASCWLAAVATFALAARARRRQEVFPPRFFKLASKSDALGYGASLGKAFAEVFELIARQDRDAFFAVHGT